MDAGIDMQILAESRGSMWAVHVQVFVFVFAYMLVDEDRVLQLRVDAHHSGSIQRNLDVLLECYDRIFACKPQKASKPPNPPIDKNKCIG